MVDYSEQSGKFTVAVHDFAADRTYSEEFDHIVVATGHHSSPHVPYFAGIEKFEGRLVHAHDLRNFREFKAQSVLVVGCRYSAEDVASQAYKYGAKSVTISYRTKPFGYKWPESIEELPLLQSIDNGNTCLFLDGSSRQINAIILCTGYVHNFPFLPGNLRLRTENRLWPLKLYKGVVWEDNHRLFYLGMQDQFFSFTMFDAQAWFVRDVILGRITLPPKEEMLADNLKYRHEEVQLETIHQRAVFQGNYIQNLMDRTDCPTFDLHAAVQLYMNAEEDKEKDIMGYRDKQYRSFLTGFMTTAPRRLWLDETDDSLETYLESGLWSDDTAVCRCLQTLGMSRRL